MIYKTTNLILDSFRAHGVKFHVSELQDASAIEAGFEIPGGPGVMVRFISNREDNDVFVRVFGLMHKIPAAKRGVVLEACNALNTKFRFVKFFLDKDSDVNLSYDFPVRTDDSCVGECCFEIFVRIMQILEKEYHVLAEALYSSPAHAKKESLELLRALRDLQDNPLSDNTGERD